MIKIFLLVCLSFQVFVSSGQEHQMRAGTEEQLNLSSIKERIAKTSAEGLEIIERAKSMRPEIQKNQSAKTLGEAVEDCINGQCEFIISPIGWEASKSEGPRWNIFFYFQDQDQKYLKAAWEYNQDKNVLIPMEFTNTTKFWVRRSKNLRP